MKVGELTELLVKTFEQVTGTARPIIASKGMGAMYTKRWTTPLKNMYAQIPGAYEDGLQYDEKAVKMFKRLLEHCHTDLAKLNLPTPQSYENVYIGKAGQYRTKMIEYAQRQSVRKDDLYPHQTIYDPAGRIPEWERVNIPKEQLEKYYYPHGADLYKIDRFTTDNNPKPWSTNDN